MRLSGINWGNLTPDQILDMEESGVSVPSEYLDWAESMNGKTDDTFDEVTSTDLNNDAGSTNEAKALYEALSDEGVSLMEIADIFENKCEVQESDMLEAMTQLKQAQEESDSVSNQLDNETATTMSELDDLLNQLGISQNNKNSGTNTSGDDSNDIVDNINGVVNDSTGVTNGLTAKLQAIGSKILSVAKKATNASETANQTLDIADKLADKGGINLAKTYVGATLGGAAGGILAGGGSIGLAAVGLIGGFSLIPVIGVGVGIGMLLGGLFGGGKKKKYAKEAQEANQAGQQLQSFVDQAKAQSAEAAKANGFSLVTGSKAVQAIKKAASSISAEQAGTGSDSVDSSTPEVSTESDDSNPKKKI